MSETNAPKLRSELAPETCWDLTQIYKTDADWEEAFRTLDDLLAAHQACRGHLADSAEMLKRGLETGDALGLRLETLYSYAHLKSDEDLANGKNAGRRDRIAARYAEIEGETSWLTSAYRSCSPCWLHSDCCGRRGQAAYCRRRI